MKKLLLFLLMGLFVGNAYAEKRLKPKCKTAVYADSGKQLGSQCHLMKQWALSVCLAYVAEDKDATHDAVYTANVLTDVAAMWNEESDKFEPLIRRYLARDYRSSYFKDVKPPPELNTGKCLDLYDSSKLDALVERVLKNRVKEGRHRSPIVVEPEKRLTPECEMAVYDDPKKQLTSNCHLLKRWAMSVCLAYATKNEEIMLDAMRTAVYHGEAASMSLDESAEFMPLIRRYLARELKPFHLREVNPHPDINTGKCLDLFASAELDSLVVRVLKDREKARKG
ncbi:MAG: type VI secretion system amidase immunity protein Tai4 [Betaproteobacteria bacterium]|nr:type VI secretion system amidase immunity protein Tai4 [Betaproteobacteria bacterium]